MSNIVDLTEALRAEISKSGEAEVVYSPSLFSGARSPKPDIKGALHGKKFRVIMFEGSEQQGLPSVSAHFTHDATESGYSSKQIDHWNSDKRFTKIYRQGQNVLLVMDNFVPENCNGPFVQSVVSIWALALKDLARLGRF